jgi:hypothetical protein
MLPSARPHLLAAALLLPGMAGSFSPAATAQAPAPAASTNLLGTVTSATADALTIQLEKGGEAVIAVTPQTRLMRTAPGEKTLKGATPIQITDLATGDRVLVLRASPGADATHYNALAVVTMKQGDIAQAHATEAEDWQKRGVGGIVKSISPAPAGSAAATIVLGTAQPGKSLTIQVTPATQIRRYAPDSINFADSKPAALAEIQPGDQLRARGDKNADGTEIAAVEIVAGSFRNVAGTITAINAAQNTITVIDLATKKPVTLKLTAETQMRKLPPEMAQRLSGRSGAAGEGGSARPAGAAAPPSGAGPGPAGAGPGAPGGPGAWRGGARGDASAMLQHAPQVTLAELKKGDAIMAVAAKAGGDASNAATAITLIAGVEPLLEGSSRSASDNLFSASWNLGGGGAEGGAPQ